MNEIDRLTNAFRSEDTASLSDPDRDSRKCDIISDIEEYASSPQVLDFLLEVAADADEYDLARIEVFKILELRPIATGAERERIGAVIAKVVLDEEDDDVVKNYAAMAAASYAAVPQVGEAVERIVLDADADPNLRANLFTCIERMGGVPRNLVLVRALLRDDEFGRTASRLLREWDDVS